ncbi:MAG: hypothetical protein APF80_05500 [Alphaproteobacteria bacterium BRH_c36]|nr:MAG: hypothetical protein APF80_05500 [Alphaproteobacteria bacterium BRH_c36]
MHRNFLTIPACAFTAILVLLICGTSYPAEALKIGDWEAVCRAPNALTGEVQEVEEDQIARHPFPPWFGRTRRNDDGTWLIEFNVLAMNVYKVSDDMKKFIFYHECAHARLNDGSERVADCDGLAQMRNEKLLDEELLGDITHTYLLISRSFPTGGPCDQYAPPLEAAVR